MSEEKFPFPKWEGYKDLESMKQAISCGNYNEPKLILEFAAKTAIEREYFKLILLFIQGRLQKYFEGESKGIGLGIDSSREIFEGLMIVPAEEVSFPEDDKENDKENDNLENFNKKKD